MKKIVFTMLILLFTISFCFAETFVMNDGSRHKGKIIKQTVNVISIQDAQGKVSTINALAIAYQIPDDNEDAGPDNKASNPAVSAVKPTKLGLITQEINNVETKMGNGAILGFGAPIAAGFLVAVIPYAFDAGNPDDAKAIAVINAVVIVAGSVAGVVGLYQYFDGLFTIGHLRAEKYELMLSPFLKSEILAGAGNSALGLELNIKI